MKKKKKTEKHERRSSFFCTPSYHCRAYRIVRDFLKKKFRFSWKTLTRSNLYHPQNSLEKVDEAGNTRKTHVIFVISTSKNQYHQYRILDFCSTMPFFRLLFSIRESFPKPLSMLIFISINLCTLLLQPTQSASYEPLILMRRCLAM